MADLYLCSNDGYSPYDIILRAAVPCQPAAPSAGGGAGGGGRRRQPPRRTKTPQFTMSTRVMVVPQARVVVPHAVMRARATASMTTTTTLIYLDADLIEAEDEELAIILGW